MSKATDLIAECKSALADVEKEIVDFERDAASEIGHFTDLAQLEIAKHRLGILRATLRNRQANVDEADTPEIESKAADPEVEADDQAQAAEPDAEKSAPKRTPRRKAAEPDANDEE